MGVCIACQEEKDVMMFYDLYDGDDRYRSVCKACRREGHKEPDRVYQDENGNNIYDPENKTATTKTPPWKQYGNGRGGTGKRTGFKSYKRGGK